MQLHSLRKHRKQRSINHFSPFLRVDVFSIYILSYFIIILQKASQVMSRAARLNEAFSVVKLVPVIRPSLPALGSTGTWPAMSLR